MSFVYYDNQTSEMFKHILLELPTDHILSTKAINERATDNEILPAMIIPCLPFLPRSWGAVTVVVDEESGMRQQQQLNFSLISLASR